MSELTDLSVRDFLGALASASPTPGGGSASALAGAMGAALVCMACNLTVGREKFAPVEAELRGVLEEATALQEQLVSAVQLDTAAYDEVSKAYKLPRSSDEEKAERTRQIQAALHTASDVPLSIAQAAARVIELGRIAKEKSNPSVASDAAVAISLARASMEGGIANVEINLGSISDKAYAEQMRGEIEALRRRINIEQWGDLAVGD